MKLTKFVKANKFILVATVLSVFTLFAGYSSLNQPSKISLAQTPSAPSAGTPITFDAPTIVVPSIGGDTTTNTATNTSAVVSTISSAPTLVANEVPTTSNNTSVASALPMPTVSAPSTPDIGALINTPAVSSVATSVITPTSEASVSVVASVVTTPVITANTTKIAKSNTPRSGGADWVVWIGALFILATGIYLQYRSKTMHKLATDEKTIN